MEISSDDIGFDIAAFEASLAEGRRERQMFRSAARRSREMDCPGHNTDQDVKDIWGFQDGKCYFCLEPLGMPGKAGAFVKDHLIPVRDHEGSHWPHNIALTCVRCNTDKHHRTERQYWTLLKKTLEPARYEILRQRAKELNRRKQPLTVHRRRDRERALKGLEQALQARVSEKLEAGPHHASTPSVWVTEGLIGTNIDVVVDCVTLTLPGVRGGVDSAKRWLSKYGHTVVAAIAVLDELNPTRRF